jgi:hypothetical protein
METCATLHFGTLLLKCVSFNPPHHFPPTSLFFGLLHGASPLSLLFPFPILPIYLIFNYTNRPNAEHTEKLFSGAFCPVPCLHCLLRAPLKHMAKLLDESLLRLGEAIHKT